MIAHREKERIVAQIKSHNSKYRIYANVVQKLVQKATKFMESIITLCSI